MFVKMQIRKTLLNGLSLSHSIAFVAMVYIAFGMVCSLQSPIVVVLSGSMEPGFKRGDLLVLTNTSPKPYTTGDIVVYTIPGMKIPIVHRVVESHVVNSHASSTESPSKYAKSVYQTSLKVQPSHQGQLLLTKGDNNHDNDLGLYDGVEFITRENVLGRVRGLIPYVGYPSIIMNESPRIKYLLLGAMGVINLLSPRGS